MRFSYIWSLLLISVAWASNIIVVNDDNFDEIVLNSDKTSFVKFFAEWCSHCKKMIPEWEKLADSYANIDEIQIVEIDADKSRGIGKRYNIASFPTIKLFRADSLSDPIDYSGQREYEFFSNFLSNQVGVKGKKVGAPSKVVQIHDGNIEKLIENKNRAAMLLFTKDNDCEECISAKKSFNELAQAFHKELDKIIIAEVQKNGDEPTDWIRELYDITEYPSIVYVEKGDIQKFHQYTDGISANELISFVNKELGLKRAANGLLDTQAGIIPEMNEALAIFVGSNIVDRRDYVTTFIEQLKKVDDSVFKNEVKYYALIVNQFIAGNLNYVDAELAKFNKKLADKSVAAEEKDLVNMKLNLLNHIKSLYTNETTREAADVMKEKEEQKAAQNDDQKVLHRDEL